MRPKFSSKKQAAQPVGSNRGPSRLSRFWRPTDSQNHQPVSSRFSEPRIFNQEQYFLACIDTISSLYVQPRGYRREFRPDFQILGQPRFQPVVRSSIAVPAGCRTRARLRSLVLTTVLRKVQKFPNIKGNICRYNNIQKQSQQIC